MTRKECWLYTIDSNTTISNTLQASCILQYTIRVDGILRILKRAKYFRCLSYIIFKCTKAFQCDANAKHIFHRTPIFSFKRSVWKHMKKYSIFLLAKVKNVIRKNGYLSGSVCIFMCRTTTLLKTSNRITCVSHYFEK